jgi:hypothetical protein
MTKFLTGKHIVDAIQSSLSTTERADFAVAYWGKGATERLGLNKTNKPVRILCDLRSLACNPNELQKLLECGFELKSKDGLHAKVYITSGKVIIGSANASANGLRQEGDDIDSELEAAVVTSDERLMKEAGEWFQHHWNGAALVDKAFLDQIRPFWRARPRPTLLSLLVANPVLFFRKPIRLIVFESPDEDEYDSAWDQIKTRNWFAEEQIKRYEGKYPFYLDSSARWNINLGEYVVSFWAGRSSKSQSYKLTNEGGFWRSKRAEWIMVDGKKTKVILADKTNDVNGLRFPDKEYKILQTCVRNYFRNNKSQRFKPPILVDVQLGDLHRVYPRIFDDLKKKLARADA